MMCVFALLVLFALIFPKIFISVILLLVLILAVVYVVFLGGALGICLMLEKAYKRFLDRHDREE